MYGLTKLDLKNIQQKHDLQRDYLVNSTFETSTGQCKTLLDVSFSANHSPRYYTELLNKINTFNDLMNSDINTIYKPVFITITLDGFYRGFLNGHFNKYDEKKHKKQIPNNERFGFLQDKIKNKEKFTIKDLYNVLNFQLDKFRQSQIFRDVKNNNHKIHYIRVCEPHKKDGVPHLHIMMYVPIQFVDRLKEFYIKYFPAPQNLKPLNPTLDDGQLKGFQYDIKSAPAYILKYIFKSFLDVKNKNDLDYLQAWYIKNRILRVVTSHSIIPAWVYRKLVPLEKDWYYLTDIKKYSHCEWSKDDDYIKFEDDTNRILEYHMGEYKLYYKTRLLQKFGTKKDEKLLTQNQLFKLKYKKIVKKPILQINNKIYKFEYYSLTPTYKINDFNINFKFYYSFNYKKRIKEPKLIINGKPFKMIDKKLTPAYILKPIKYRSNFDLYSSYINYKEIELDDYKLKEFALIRNELIKRNQILGDIISPNDYNSSFDF